MDDVEQFNPKDMELVCTLEDVIDRYLLNKGVSLWMNWEITKPDRRKEAVQWLCRTILDVLVMADSNAIVAFLESMTGATGQSVTADTANDEASIKLTHTEPGKHTTSDKEK